MRWRRSSAHAAISECGNYEVRQSIDPARGAFYNAWYRPTKKHIDASHQKSDVRKACEAHAARMDAGVPA